MRTVLCMVLVACWGPSGIAAETDPGAGHEAKAKAAQKRAGGALREIEKRIADVETDSVEFAALQKKYRDFSAEKKSLEAKIAAALKASAEYAGLVEEKKKLDADRRVASKAGDRKKVDALNKARYQNHVKVQKLKGKLLPAEHGRNEELGRKLATTRKRLVAVAVRDLAAHPELGTHVKALKDARTKETRERAAMLAARGQVTPLQYLASQKAPRFKRGHTLPPLTRYGWSQPFALRKAFADGWGYAVELGGYVTGRTLEKMDDPDSDEAKTIALVNSDPKKYKLSVICARHFPKEVPPGTWTRDAEGKLLKADAKSYDGTQWHPGMKTVISPLAPDELWAEFGRGRAEPLAAVRARAPISIVLNGGEYGLGVKGFAGKVWKLDPRVAEQITGRDWFEFLSKHKARAEKIIADAVRAAVPDRELYIYYTTSGCGHRNRYGGWSNWAFDYKHMHVASDLPSDEHYANHFNSGWLGKMDILSMALNSTGVQIAQGHPLAYSWFWCKRRDENMRVYMGFLKCIYVMGTIGGNAGAYHYPDFTAGFEPEDPPYWLEQMVVLARVHAFFSHLEDHIRNGELEPGPYRHYWTVDNPAYELLPAGMNDVVQDKSTRGGEKVKVLEMGRPVRVLARRHARKKEALVAVWAADGEKRDVTVDVPGFGEVNLVARDVGSVYRVRKGWRRTSVELLDTNEECPSWSFR